MAERKGGVLVLLLVLWTRVNGDVNQDPSTRISEHDQCHCALSSECAEYPDVTCSACEEFWSGSNCQILNFARSDANTTRFADGSANSNLVIDGDSNDIPYRCTSVTDTDVTAVWSLILNNKHHIHRLKIYHFSEKASSFSSFEVKVNAQLCKKWSSSDPPPRELDITCDQPIYGDLVSISVDQSVDYVKTLALCEVELYECGDYWHGDQCDQRCSCADVTEICNKRDGTCVSGPRETTGDSHEDLEEEVGDHPPQDDDDDGEDGEESEESEEKEDDRDGDHERKHGDHSKHRGKSSKLNITAGEIAGLIVGTIFLLTIATAAIVLVIKMKCVRQPKVEDAPEVFHSVAGPMVHLPGNKGTYFLGPEVTPNALQAWNSAPEKKMPLA